MSKSERTKGAGGERELCKILTDALGEKVTRRLNQTRDSGHDIDLPPFRIEVKRRRRIAIYEWMNQVCLACSDFCLGRGTPVVAMRADNEDWLVVMRLDDWIRLAREEIAE